ncbi:MAG: hypothetical protein Rubg2KO_24000 [Rubricoccaceae bacterium]
MRLALLLGLVVALAAPALAQAPPPQNPDRMVRTAAAETPFAPLFPGVEAYTLYGGLGADAPTAILATTDPAASVAIPHTHTHGYWGYVLAGRHQHWELSEPDQGPILTAGSSWYQPAGEPHADKCLGPEACVTLVVFDVAADFVPSE